MNKKQVKWWLEQWTFQDWVFHFFFAPRMWAFKLRYEAGRPSDKEEKRDGD